MEIKKKKPSWRFDGISGGFANVTIEFNFFFGIVRRMAVTPLTLFCFGNVSFGSLRARFPVRATWLQRSDNDNIRETGTIIGQLVLRRVKVVDF